MKKEYLMESFTIDAKCFKEVKSNVTESRKVQLAEGKEHELRVLRTIRGPMGVVNEATGNGRSYAKSEMESAINNVKALIEGRALLGQLDHPEKEPKLNDVSHIITKLWFENQNGREYMFGEWEIVDTPKGITLNNLYEAKAGIGTSYRGYGIVGDNGEVTEYDFKGVDAVFDPSAGTFISEDFNFDAEVGAVIEGKETDPEITKRLDEIKESFESVKKELKGLKTNDAILNQKILSVERFDQPSQPKGSISTTVEKQPVIDVDGEEAEKNQAFTNPEVPTDAMKSEHETMYHCPACQYMSTNANEFISREAGTLARLACPKCDSTGIIRQTNYKGGKPVMAGEGKEEDPKKTPVTESKEDGFTCPHCKVITESVDGEEGRHHCPKCNGDFEEATVDNTDIPEEKTTEAKLRDAVAIIEGFKKFVKSDINNGSIISISDKKVLESLGITEDAEQGSTIVDKSENVPQLFRVASTAEGKVILSHVGGEKEMSSEEFEEKLQSGAIVKVPETPQEGDEGMSMEPDTGIEPDDALESKQIEEELYKMRDYALACESVIGGVRDYALKVEKYAEKLEKAIYELRDHTLKTEEVGDFMGSKLKKTIKVIEGMKDYTLKVEGVAEDLKKKLSEAKKPVEESKSPETHAVKKMTSRAVRTYPFLESLSEELLTSKNLEQCENKIRKYVTLFKESGHKKIDISRLSIKKSKAPVTENERISPKGWD